MKDTVHTYFKVKGYYIKMLFCIIVAGLLIVGGGIADSDPVKIAGFVFIAIFLVIGFVGNMKYKKYANSDNNKPNETH